MKYFAFIANAYTLKNSLEKAVYAELEKINRSIIPGENIAAVKVQIIDLINKTNEAFPRCHPLHVHWQDSRSSTFIMEKYPDFKLWIGSGSICNFYLYASKKEE